MCQCNIKRLQWKETVLKNVLAMMSKEEQQLMKAQCEPKVEPKLRES